MMILVKGCIAVGVTIMYRKKRLALKIEIAAETLHPARVNGTTLLQHTKLQRYNHHIW
jgi:hypothetical protein